MVDRAGIVYLRTTRESLPVLYPADEPFPIGGSRLARSSDSDDVTVVGAGITLHEALAAAETLAGEGISTRVIDLYSVKPIDAATLVEAAEATGGIVVVEDHWPEGGHRTRPCSRRSRARRASNVPSPGSRRPACRRRARRPSCSTRPASTAPTSPTAVRSLVRASR